MQYVVGLSIDLFCRVVEHAHLGSLLEYRYKFTKSCGNHPEVPDTGTMETQFNDKAEDEA